MWIEYKGRKYFKVPLEKGANLMFTEGEVKKAKKRAKGVTFYFGKPL